jgi:hypothetical protein
MRCKLRAAHLSQHNLHFHGGTFWVHFKVKSAHAIFVTISIVML